jgi:hypothetical protein
VSTEAESNGEQGICCPECGCRSLRVSYKKPFQGGYRRIKFCNDCGRKIVTQEVRIAKGIAKWTEIPTPGTSGEET